MELTTSSKKLPAGCPHGEAEGYVRHCPRCGQLLNPDAAPARNCRANHRQQAERGFNFCPDCAADLYRPGAFECDHQNSHTNERFCRGCGLDVNPQASQLSNCWQIHDNYLLQRCVFCPECAENLHQD